MIMIEKNKEIMEFLEYYSNMTVPPQYAVMIKGKWGTGKTWFIENYIRMLGTGEKRVLYVSLYGITAIQQIEDEFFRQLHPVLSSKSVAFAGKLFKGLVRGTLKIDLNGDGKDDGSIAIGTPDLKLPEYLRNTNSLVLVFDDLERCSMPISSVLGYINYFVEHDQRKVILVCNEEAIIAAENTKEKNVESNYIKIKEKLIGKTFSISPDFDAAFQSFLADVSLISTREILQAQTENIKRMYVNAGYKNFRHLRQAILDFSRLLELLENKFLIRNDLITHLLRFFLLYSFEIKNGSMLAKDISLIEGSLFKSVIIDDEQLKENLHKKLSLKYGDINIIDSLLPASTWESIFDTGLFNRNEINTALSRSKYFLLDSQPMWLTLWNMHSLTDDQLEQILKGVGQRLHEEKVESMGELKQIISSLLYLSKVEVYKHSASDITALGLRNARKITQEKEFLRQDVSKDMYDIRESGFGGYGYHEKESEDFKNFVKAANEVAQDAIENSYPDKATLLLEIMVSDTSEFTGALVHSNFKKSDYYSKPILSFVVPQNFVEALGRLHPEQLRQVHYMIEERYSFDHYSKLLKKESLWLTESAMEMCALLETRRGKLSGISLEHLRNAMLKAAEKLAQC